MATNTLEVPSLKGSDRSARRRRRLLLPVLTAVVALVLWVMNSRIGPAREADVETFVRRLIEQAAPPRPDLGAIPNTERVISDLVRETLRDMRADGSPPSFTLHRRGSDGARAHAQATHTAVIVDGSGTRMALGIMHPGDASRMGIVGVEVGLGPDVVETSAPADPPAGGDVTPPGRDAAEER